MSNFDSVRFSSSSFQKSLAITAFDSLLRQETLIDVTLASEGQFLRAHRLVLCAYSDYFKELLVIQPEKHPILYLRDVPFSHVEALIAFMYRGEVDIPKMELMNFMKTADSLRIKGLSNESQESPEVCSELVKLPAETSLARKNANLKSSKFNFNGAKASSAFTSKSFGCGSKRSRSESPNAAVGEAFRKTGIQVKRIPVVRLSHVETFNRAVRKYLPASPPRCKTPDPMLPLPKSVQSPTIVASADSWAIAEVSCPKIEKETIGVEDQLCDRTEPKQDKIDMSASNVTLVAEDGSDVEVQDVSQEVVILESPEVSGSGVAKSLEGLKCETPLGTEGELFLHESTSSNNDGENECEKGWKTIYTEAGEERFQCLNCSRQYCRKERVLYHCVRRCNGDSRCLCFTCSYKAK